MLMQCAPRVGAIAGNVELIKNGIESAETHGCDFIVFPELMLTGYPPEDLLFRPAFTNQVTAAIDEVIQHSQSACVIFGSPSLQNKRLRNSVFLCQNGRLLGQYDKTYLPNYGVFDECRYFEAGDQSPFFDINGHRIGIGVCEDLWHDDWAIQLAEESCDLWLNLNASPFHLNKQSEREQLTSRRAQQFGVPVVYVNAVGGQDEVVFDGGSHVMSAAGQLLVRLPLFKVYEYVIDIDAFPESVVADAATNIASIGSESEQIYDALVMGIRDYVLRNGCKQVLLGLSGGIDSAVTAALACEALGHEQVLGVLLPSRYSSDHSVNDSLALAKSLEIETITLPIAEPVDALEQALHTHYPGWKEFSVDVTEENIQARTRGVLLMAVSNKTGRMLLTTGNKSEMAVGYATLYGDMAGGFAVLKDVYKTQVYALAHYINREQELIPLNTIEKPPSAELRPDQKDSDSLPDYDVLDAILNAMIEQRKGVAELVAEGFKQEEVTRVMRLLLISEYKRRQSPPGVKITERAFGRDRRYPITHSFWQW